MAKKKKGKLPDGLKGVKVNTPMFRLAFPRLFTPEPYEEGGKPVYTATLLLPKESSDKVYKEMFAKMKAGISKAAEEAFGKDKKKWPKGLFNPLQDGDSEEKDMSRFEGFADHWYINAKTEWKPLVIDKTKQRIENEDEIYPGCYCDAVIVFKATESAGRFYISAYLQGVRMLKEGENLAGGCSASEFEDYDFGDDDDSSTTDDNDFGGGSNEDEDEDEDFDNMYF